MGRHRVDYSEVYEQSAEFLDLQRLWIDLVHAALDRLLDVLVLYVASDGDDLWLDVSLDHGVVEDLPNLLGGFVAIKEGHVAVHEDELVLARVALVDAFLNDFYGLFTIVSEGGPLLPICIAEDHEESVDDVAVELFIVNNKDVPRVALRCVHIIVGCSLVGASGLQDAFEVDAVT